MATPRNDTYLGTPGTTLYVGKQPPVLGSVISTVSLANETSDTQNSGFVSPMFGLPIKQGDVPSGTYPQFVVNDDTLCPATLWGVTSWPDGSMKFCGVMLKVPAVIPPGGTLEVEVKSGGTLPAASSHTTSQLTAADLKIQLTGVTNLTGTWVASLNTAIADATDVVVIGSGPAGKIWRIGGPCKQSGAAHGQLHAWHYVAALTNSEGGLLGLRYLGRVAQPWADVSTPTPNYRVVTCALFSGSTSVRSLLGHNTNETPGSNINIDHYTSFFTAGTNAQWDFVQGGGSNASDCVVRVVHNKTDVARTRLVPPYDLTLAANVGSSYDHYAMGAGPIMRDMGTTGEREDIAVLPAWVVRHILTQSAQGARAVRVAGLVSGGWHQAARRSTTNQVIPTVDVVSSYAGLGAVQTNWRGPVSYINGFVAPTNNNSLWKFDHEPSHRPSATYYPYLITGEPQYLDLLVEQAAGMMSCQAPGGNVWKTSVPITEGTPRIGDWTGDRNPTINGTTYKGAGLFFQDNLTRLIAWGTRDVTQVAAIYPDVCTSGTETRKYFRDVVDSNYAALKAYNTAMPQSWRDTGAVAFRWDGAYDAPWCTFYLSNSVCHQASIYPTANTQDFRAHMSRFYTSIHAVADISCVSAYRMSYWGSNRTRVNSSIDAVFSTGCELTARASDDVFTWVSPVVTTITNGDSFMFDLESGKLAPFADAAHGTRYFAVAASGNTFKLSKTKGGSPENVTTDETYDSILVLLKTASPMRSFESSTGADGYASSMRGAIRHHEACGDVGMTAVRIAQDNNVALNGTTYTSEPKNAMALAYPI